MLFQTSVAADERAKILILGDSLSAGYRMDLSDSWTTLLQTKLDNLGYGYQVVNASISGDTTGGGLLRLPRALKVHQPEIVIIELGGNDGLRAYSIDTVRRNMTALVEKSQDSGAEVIVTGMQIPPNYGDAYANQFSAVFVEVAEATGAAVIPLFLQGVALDPDLMQADNIHPNAKAQPKLLDTVWAVLKPLLQNPAG